MMKKILFMCAAVLLTAFAANAQKKQMNARDYFLAIPAEFVKADAKKRASWIGMESLEIGYLEYEVPLKELLGDDAQGEGRVFGYFQVFEKDAGGVVVGMANNMCADGECLGMMQFLDYTSGKWSDASEDYLIIPDNDEVVAALRDSPAWKKPLKDGVQVPLAVEFNGNDKAVHFLAGCTKTCDGAVSVKHYKWNGAAFAEYELEESPE